MGTGLITLCQECLRPLDVHEQLRLIDDPLAWPTIVEVCYRCEAPARTDRSLRVEMRRR